MTNRISFLLISLSILFTACQPMNGQEIPQAVKDSFQKKYPKEKSPDWSVDSHGYYEAQFKKDGEKYRADFKSDGQWIETENSIKFDDLPKAVRKVVEKDYDKGDITEIERVEHHSKGLFFDVEFKRPGKNKDVELNAEGKVLN